MKYIIGFIFACSLGLNAAFLYNLKRYQIEVRERKTYTDQKISYYEYWSFTFPREVGMPDTALNWQRRFAIELDGASDSTLPQRNYYVQFSHNYQRTINRQITPALADKKIVCQ